MGEEVPVKRQRSTAQVRIAHTCEGCGNSGKPCNKCKTAMYVKEEFVCGEVFSVGGHPCGPKTARTRFWTVLVLSDDDEDSESEDELRDRVYARGGESRSKSIAARAIVHRAQPMYLRFYHGDETKMVSFATMTVGELISEIEDSLLEWEGCFRCLFFKGKGYTPGGAGTEKLLSEIDMHRKCTAHVELRDMRRCAWLQ